MSSTDSNKTRYPERNIEQYMEYEIINNRPGLLGDISSLLGNLGISIDTINGVENERRGLLIRTDELNKLKRFELMSAYIDDINILKIRKPQVRDRLAVRHGRFIKRAEDDKKIFRFTREEIGILVDFLAELFKEDGHKMIGVRGMPRVGKTESIVAASVTAKKKWLFLSSTLIKQTERTTLIKGEYDQSNVFIIDGAVTNKSTNEEHKSLIREVMRFPAVKVIEHPDLFVDGMNYTLADYDYIIELREDEDQEITYEKHQKQHWFQDEDMSFFGGM
ncbi:YmfK family protein [Salinicoccus jeotgali]|uniref:YmfK family protein n=1 Tax=Salinicoccus jeotgali TaxID=381634 RepID=A0ABP7EHF0_9STAP